MPDELGGFGEPTSRLALARRLYLDLTGLPPSADELSSIDHDLQVDAIERLIDRLLASPRFGERWSRWWLDLAHYADSDGYLQDFLRPHAWRYRDWVVDAFNNDMPFDQFTLAQIAGDLLAVRAVGERPRSYVWQPDFCATHAQQSRRWCGFGGVSSQTSRRSYRYGGYDLVRSDGRLCGVP